MKSFILLAAFVGYAVAECPNSCSGHGMCQSYDQCECQKEGVVINPEGNIFKAAMEKGESPEKSYAWTGADCSLMRCPRGISWVTAARDENEASTALCEHETGVECSEKGLCDRTSGQCTCFPGYTGAACQRTSCPNDCSGHGICQSNVKFAQDATILMDPSLYAEYGFNADFDYLISYDKAWDSGLHFGCKCDIGYRGPDCSLVECPSEDDPLDDFCTGGRTGLGYIEFVGSEYYFGADTGSLDPQEAPLPNKLLLFVEDYESSQVTNNDNGCQITVDGEYRVTDQRQLADALKESSHHQQESADESYKRFRSGVVNAAKPGNASPQANAQDAVDYSNWLGGQAFDPIPSPGNAQDNGVYLTMFDDAPVNAKYVSDCVNGVYCGGARFGEPCSGRGLCNYADGTCECHSGYAGNACNEVEELS